MRTQAEIRDRIKEHESLARMYRANSERRKAGSWPSREQRRLAEMNEDAAKLLRWVLDDSGQEQEVEQEQETF